MYSPFAIVIAGVVAGSLCLGSAKADDYIYGHDHHHRFYRDLPPHEYYRHHFEHFHRPWYSQPPYPPSYVPFRQDYLYAYPHPYGYGYGW